MSKIQTALSKCVDDVAALLGSLSDGNSSCSHRDLEQAFMDFYSRSWMLGDLSEPQNAALVTVSCIPLWELLNLFSGILTPLSGASKAVAVALLTTLYPKSNDRRCLFQQADVVGSDAANCVPLFIPVPTSVEIMSNSSLSGTDAFKRCFEFVQNPIAAQAVVSTDRALAISKLVAFTTAVVPSCCFVPSASVGSAHGAGKCVFHLDRAPGSSTSPFSFFAGIVWNFLVLADLLKCPEGSELKKALTASPWAAQMVTVKGKKITYGSLVSPIVDASIICLKTCSTPAPTTDNTPVVESAALTAMMTDNTVAANESDFDFASPCELKKLPVLRASVVADVEEQLTNQLFSSIPQEVEFFSTSATCRDCDQLTMLCRNLLSSPVRIRRSNYKCVDLQVSSQLNFDRKRPRGGDDGPALLPVTLALSDTLAETNSAPTVLERLCTHWSAAAATS